MRCFYFQLKLLYEYDEAADGEASCEFVPHRSCDMNRYYEAYKENYKEYPKSDGDEEPSMQDRYKAHEHFWAFCNDLRPQYETAIELV